MVIDRHRHDVGLETTLAFINTLEHGRDGDTEHLPSLDVALDWLVAHDVLHADAGEATRRGPRPATTLDRIRDLRTALREVADAVVEGRRPAFDAVEATNRALRRLDSPTLIPTDSGAILGHSHGRDPLGDALGRLVRPLAELIADEDTARLKVCANDECRWVFLDTSRTHRRRWCDMATCGNRAKAARHRARVQATTA